MRIKKPRIIQLMPTLKYGDGVGNDALAMHGILAKNGYDTKIYAENIDERIPKDVAQRVENLPALKKQDVILYHLSTGTLLNERLPQMTGRKVIIYHNITPSHFFEPYHAFSVALCKEGRNALAALKNVPEYCLADSAYNMQELAECGYACPMDVLPIIIPYEDYKKTPDAGVLKQYQGDGCTNIIFTGRISPNKKQEDIIEAFACYQKYYNPNSRLFLVGAYQGMERYKRRLEAYAQKLEVQNVIFTGHIPFEQILAYYHLADLFLCMSEHEGFCIPLVEAMLFDVPIIAYESTGVTDTLGGGGILLKEKNGLETAALMHYVLSHDEIKDKIREGQKKQIERFSIEKTQAAFLAHIKTFINQK